MFFYVKELIRSIISMILIFFTTLIYGFEKPSNEFKPGEGPKWNFFKNGTTINTNRNSSNSDIQRDPRESFYTFRNNTQPKKDINCFGGT